MTVTVEWAESVMTPSAAARRSGLRVRPVTLLAVLVVVGLVGLFVFSHRRAQARLDDTRAQLDETTETLAAVQTDLDRARDDTALTEDELDATRSEIEFALAVRTWIEAVTANTLGEIVAVDANQAEIDAARLLVAANSNDAQVCFDGVSQAVQASRNGDDRTSTDALRAAAGHCTRTLAYATGARFPYDFADPFVLHAGGAYYGYSTNSGAGDVQVIRSADMIVWELVGNALAALPSWAAPHATWAPAVLTRDGGYVLYYTVREAASQRQCISLALAATPAGPFRDDSTGPLVCQPGGSIDPSPFVDSDGRAHLLWKSDGLDGAAPSIWSQELTADGLAVTGTAQLLVSVDQPFERGVVEAPTLVHERGTYFLVYAAGSWTSRNYSTAYATCVGPAGPCVKPVDGRILTSGLRIAGPGGAELFRDHDGALWAAFHAFSEPNVGYPSSRYLYVARVRVGEGRIRIDATT